MAIDNNKLPGRALIDSGVVMRALGDLPDDPRARPCVEFFLAMLANGREMLIAAPTLAEVMRKDASATRVVSAALVAAGADRGSASAAGLAGPMSRRIPASSEQHLQAAKRLREARRAIRRCFMSEGGPSVTAAETDVLLALDRAVVHCGAKLQIRMQQDGQATEEWDYLAVLGDESGKWP